MHGYHLASNVKLYMKQYIIGLLINVKPYYRYEIIANQVHVQSQLIIVQDCFLGIYGLAVE